MAPVHKSMISLISEDSQKPIKTNSDFDPEEIALYEQQISQKSQLYSPKSLLFGSPEKNFNQFNKESPKFKTAISDDEDRNEV